MRRLTAPLTAIAVFYILVQAQFVEFNVNTHTYHGYQGPNNVIAAWVSDSIFGYIRTFLVTGSLEEPWGARKQLTNLAYVAGLDSTDAVTGATLRGHGHRKVIWDCTDLDGNPMPEGRYFLNFEMNETHTFTHGSFPNPIRFYRFHLTGDRDSLIEYAPYDNFVDSWLGTQYPEVPQTIFTDADIAYYAPGPGTIQLVDTRYVHREGKGAAEITVERIRGRTGAVSVTWAVGDDSAIDGEDFTAASATIDWGDNEYGPRTFSVEILDDDIAEDVKSALLTLSDPGGGAGLGVVDNAALTIVDDDGPISDDGLVGYWGFDLGNGQTVFDGSGAGNHGTLNYTVRTQGGDGNAGDFTAFDAYVEFTNDPSLSLTGPLSIALWVYPVTKTDTAQVLVQALNQYILSIEADHALKLSDGFEASVAAATDALTFDDWNHVAAVFSGAQAEALTAGNAKIYINGTDAGAAVSGTWSPLAAPHGTVTLGTNHFSGTLDEVYIYNRALDQGEITALAAATPGTGVISAGRRSVVVEGVRVGPNPFRRAVTLRLPKDHGGATIRIVTPQGREVASFHNVRDRSVTWKPRDEASGIYLFQVHMGDKVYQEKLLYRQ